MGEKQPNYSILNTIQASAADADLSAGVFLLTGLAEGVRLVDAIDFVKKSYAAGTLSVKTVAFASGVTLAADTMYELVVTAPSNPAIAPRVYNWMSGSSAPTAAQVAAGLEAEIVADTADDKIASSSVSTSTITLTLLDLDYGDFQVTVKAANAVQSPTVTATTPFVEPAGTPAIVTGITSAESGSSNGQVNSSGNYTHYKIRGRVPHRHNEVGGAYVGAGINTHIFLDEGATNFSALETEIDAILAGTHTAASDYLGLPSA